MKRGIQIAMVTCLFCFAEVLQAQHIGIGTNTPTGPLSFGNIKDNLGLTISLRNQGYGIGTAGNHLLFTLQKEEAGSHNILLGHGRSAAFTELMRIQNNRRVGIGVTNPQMALDVNGRIRLKWFGSNTTPGILYSYYKYETLVGPYFLGMLNNSTFGLLTVGTSVFQYEAINGALGLNGSYGTSGQIAMVKEGDYFTTEYSTTWNNIPTFSDVYNGTAQYFEPNAYTLTDAAPSANLTGFSLSLAYPKPTKILLDYALTVSTNSCASCGTTYFRVKTFSNGTLENMSTYMVANGRTSTVTDGILLWLNTGKNITMSVEKISGPPLTLPVTAGRVSTLIVSSFPNN